MKYQTHTFRGVRRNASALVVTLAFLVLLSVAVLAYFSQASLNRKISFASAGQARAETIAMTAMDIIQGDLVAEILSGSSTNTVAGITIFTPLAGSGMIPFRMTNVTDMAPLVKWSAGNSNLWSGSAYTSSGPVRAAAGNSSTSLSANGRYISLGQWSKPSFGSNYPSDATPAWVLVTRSGPLQEAQSAASKLSELALPAASNTNFVIGRFAYAIYDVGGLIDLTAAGYPAGMTEDTSRKGSLGYADLGKLGLSTNEVTELVHWRNAGSMADYSKYLAEFARKYGFMRAAPGDQTFVGRQDLIQFWTNKFGSDTNALRFLTTFSRENNAPSWGPRKNAADLGGNNNGVNIAVNPGQFVASAYAYGDRANDTSFTLRFFPRVRVKSAFLRQNGKMAVPGEPLVQSRFDLSRLSWIRHDGVLPDGVTAANIHAAFGLTRNSDGSWIYNHGASDRILTLEEVASANREPDFFELLQATILPGSLGLLSGNPQNQADAAQGGELYRRLANVGTSSLFNGAPSVRTDQDGQLVHGQEKYQIIQIGANLIDQADVDGFPTELILNGEHFYGVENLPYINALGDTALRPPPGGAIAPNDYQAYVHRWMTVALWNPHQNAQIPPTQGPRKVRAIVRSGEIYPFISGAPRAQTPPNQNNAALVKGRVFSPTSPGWLAVNIADYPNRFSEPTTISYDRSQASEPEGRLRTAMGWERAGIYMGWSYSPENTNKVAASAGLPTSVRNNDLPTDTNARAANLKFIAPLTVELQYEDGGVWRTYQEIRGLVYGRDGRGDPFMEWNDPAWSTCVTRDSGTSEANKTYGPIAQDTESWVVSFLDPRATRLNMPSRRGRKLDQTFSVATTIDTAAPAGPRFPKDPKIWAHWVNNASSAASYYTDGDGVMRKGDAGGWSGADPLPIATQAQRPLMLDRPFRNAGELGVVFRDVPWKTLDFNSTNSADAGLVDVFTVGPETAPASSTVPETVAGRVNLNSATVPVLKALISGVGRNYRLSDPTHTDSTVSSDAEIEALANDIIATLQTNGPLINIADLTATFPQTTSVTARFPGNKFQREALMRALVGTSGVRTWNLMIDVIAQSGRFSANPTTLNDFIVEGEKRYWLHIAIDRFTGKVIDHQLEPVFEW